jgi:hypothetical protein
MKKNMETSQSKEFKNFDAAMRKILTVSHDELKRREEEWKLQKQEKRKAKPSASGRASRAKD